MQAVVDSPVLTVLLVVALLAMLEAGRRLGMRRRAGRADGSDASGIGTIDGAVFALFGLLLAFTFTNAAGRFDERRALIAQEANAAGTAWMRLDTLPAAARAPLQGLLRDYVRARLDATGEPSGRADASARAARLQREIWTRAVEASAGSPGVQTLVLGALNELFDLATTRAALADAHPPTVIWVMLVVLALVSALLAGDAMAGARSPPLLHMVAFAVVIAATVHTIVDLEYPRTGLVRIDAADAVLRDALRAME